MANILRERKNSMITLGDLSRYNSSSIIKTFFDGAGLTTKNTKSFKSISIGLNAFTSNVQSTSTLGTSGYEGIIALLKALADARNGSSTQETKASSNSSTANTSVFAGIELPILKDTSNIFSPPTTPTTVDPPAQPEPPTPPAPPPQIVERVVERVVQSPPPPPPPPQIVERVVERVVQSPPPPPPPPQPIVFSGPGGDGKTQYQGVQTADGQRQDIYWRDANNQVLYSSVRTKNSDNTWTDVKKDQAGNVTISKYDANFKPI
jgi:hypothetical protein